MTWPLTAVMRVDQAKWALCKNNSELARNVGGHTASEDYILRKIMKLHPIAKGQNKKTPIL